MNVEKKHTLTQDQINAIFAFTSKKYVKYYDVQLELVDHVASKIEELMEADTMLTFEVALQQVYKSYGIFGFTKVAETKMIALNKLWTKRLLSFLSSYLTVPKVLLTSVLTLLFYSVFSLMPSLNMDPMLWQGITFGIVMLAVIIHGIVQKRKRTKGKYQLSVIDSYHAYSSMAIFWFHIPIQMIMIAPVSPFFCFLTSVVFAFFLITVYGLLFVFPNYLEEDIMKSYAHLQLESV